MPLTMDEKLLALSRGTIEVFDKVNGGVHPGFRPAHAKGILLTGMFTPSSEVVSLTRAPHLHRDSTPVTVRFSDFAGFRPLPITTRRAPAHAGLRFTSTSASMFTPTSSVIRSTPSRCALRRGCSSSSMH
jgi:catalase